MPGVCRAETIRRETGMPFYENVFIARQDISTPQVESLADDFTKIIEDQGGTVAKREYWGLRGLAYRIKKNRKAHYVLFNIDAPAEAVHEMERQMRLHEDVLRYLTLRVDELEEGPSAMMQRRGGREDREGRDGRAGREGRDGRAGRPRRDEPQAPQKHARAEKGTDRPAKTEAPDADPKSGDDAPADTAGDKAADTAGDKAADTAGDKAAGKTKAAAKAKAEDSGRGAAARKKPAKAKPAGDDAKPSAKGASADEDETKGDA